MGTQAGRDRNQPTPWPSAAAVPGGPRWSCCPGLHREAVGSAGLGRPGLAAVVPNRKVMLRQLADTN